MYGKESANPALERLKIKLRMPDTLKKQCKGLIWTRQTFWGARSQEAKCEALHLDFFLNLIGNF